MSENDEIHVDDDWKKRAEAEREAASKQSSESPESEEHQIPEASFPLLVSTLATQAIAALGQMPDPATGKATIYKPLARHMIDLLGVLDEKTKGNLDEDEQKMLTEILSQLRMLYVQTPDMPPSGDLPSGNSDAGGSGSSIVMP